MQKHNKDPPDTESQSHRSCFTLTFAIEIVGIDVWHDCNEGWLDLGPAEQGLKIQYNLYPGHHYDIDILVWPHTAKVYCGVNSCWVRTWQFLERRWLTFTIRHAFPIKVMDFRDYTVDIHPTFGLGSVSANAKNEKNLEVYLPLLEFGQRRYFATVQETEEVMTLTQFARELIWGLVINHIPRSVFDGLFDCPQTVTDVRHQDAVIYQVQQKILDTTRRSKEDSEIEVIDMKNKDKKKAEKEIPKYEIKLSGDTIIAGTGRLTPFEVYGSKPPDTGEIITLISTDNLPAQDDHPVIFINVGKLTDIPVVEFMKQKISQIYIKWTIANEDHRSEPQKLITSKPNVDFNDYHAVPLPFNLAADIKASLSDDHYIIELRGLRTLSPNKEKPQFFGYDKGDHSYGMAVPPKATIHDTDVIIATTKIDCRLLKKSLNAIINSEYPLYPPQPSVVKLDREEVCTNDINVICGVVKPDLVVPTSVILEAQMTLEVSIGFVGCKPMKKTRSFSRFYCSVKETELIMTLLHKITEINETLFQQGNRQELLTGFCIDLGDSVFLYVEGPKDGRILNVWESAAGFHPRIKPVFSTVEAYHCRLYPELLLAPKPFNVLKMYAPLPIILAIPPVYARPTLPLPARSALLKIGQLITSKPDRAPSRDQMPTANELKSFRLELCVAPRPSPMAIASPPDVDMENRASLQSSSRIYWAKKKEGENP